MKKLLYTAIVLLLISCNNSPKEKLTISAKEVVGLNQIIYKDSSHKAFPQYAKDYELVFHPEPVDGNYAVIVKNKSSNKYNLVIRGSVLEFSNAGFQNFIIQDFNIFTMKEWKYTDTVKEAFVSQGVYTGFENLLKLKDIQTKLTIQEYIEKNVPKHALLTVTGHSLGGNLANLMASYLKKELKNSKKIDMQLITFGAPASGNAAFVQNLEDQFPKGERYEMEMDIACAFPDLDKVSSIASKIGLDSSLNLGKITIDNTTESFKVGTVFKIAEVILNETNILSDKKRYTQSKKQLKPLKPKVTENETNDDVDALFTKAYSYHSVNQYAKVLEGDVIK